MSATTCLQQAISLNEKKSVEKPAIYSPEELISIDPALIPKHIAFIPDGNRRWAERNNKYNQNSSFGHRPGADILIDTVKAAKELGVKVVTFYTFSTENWVRKKEEVDALMWLFHSYLISNREMMLEEGIRLGIIGDLSKIPNPARDTILETKEITKKCNDIDMVLAINYGGRDEIARAVRKIAEDVQSNALHPSQIDESLISKTLDTHPYGDPDLLVRTSGEMRLSNFLIWQLSYAELYVVDVLWPDFSAGHLLDAVTGFQKRERRHGT